MKRSTILGIFLAALILLVFGLSIYLFISRINKETMFASPLPLMGSKKVAVVEIIGVISDSKSIIEKIVKFRKNDSVKAVVLRIDSPGGAVGPAQEIYEEVKKTKAVKKVVASMGSVAASGGYYVACGADKIVANPGTLTGSIGALFEFMNLKELMHWAKIKGEVVKSGEFKDVGYPFRDMTSRERALLQELINNVHSQFKRAVVESRGLPAQKVDKIADGRIFTGEQAKELGLVDELGNLEDAVALAAKLAGIEGEPTVIYPEKPRRQLLDLFFEDAAAYIMKQIHEGDWFKLSYQ